MFDKIRSFATILSIISFTTNSLQQASDTDFSTTFNNANNECIQQYGMQPDYVNNEIWAMQQIPNDNNLKCYFSCVSVKIGVMDEKGDIDDDVLEKACSLFYNVTLAEKMDDTCDIAKDGDLCQTAYDMMQCVLNMQNGKQ